MIYLADDYLENYIEKLCYIIERAVFEEYSFDCIERTIAYSLMISELEKSNVTIIAFTNHLDIYKDLFPFRHNDYFASNIYGMYGWISECYIRLFLSLEITFETLFTILPLQKMIELYPLHHELSFSYLEDYVDELVPYSYLDAFMRKRRLSSQKLSSDTGIPVTTIKALRYGKRDVNKLESQKLLKICIALNIKMESLLTNICLVKH